MAVALWVLITPSKKPDPGTIDWGTYSWFPHCEGTSNNYHSTFLPFVTQTIRRIREPMQLLTATRNDDEEMANHTYRKLYVWQTVKNLSGS